MFGKKFKGKVGEIFFSLMSKWHLPKEYIIYNNIVVKMKKGTTQIDQIVFSKHGIFVVEIKTFKGWIYGGEYQREWTQVFNKNSKFKFKNPIHQNWLHIKALKETLKYKIKDEAFKSVILFSGEVKLKSDFPDYVVKGLNYIDYIKSFKDEILTEIEMNYIVEMMKEHQGASKDHKKYIKKLKDERSSKTESTPFCPVCGKTMKLRKSKKGQDFWGCSDFPKCKKTLSCIE